MIMKPEIQIDHSIYTVKEIRFLTESAFILRLPKSRFKFEAGQHLSLSIAGDYQSREYSIYNGEEDPYLEVLVKEVEGGYFTPKLKYLKPGDKVQVNGPFGRFTIDESKLHTHQHVFIASGTGIAPFHSMVKSNPGIDYRIIHGVRVASEAYERDEYEKNRYLLCTSRENTGDFAGRLTTYLQETQFAKNSCFYLCGNSDMIFDAMEIIKEKGFTRDDVNVEVYF